MNRKQQINKGDKVIRCNQLYIDDSRPVKHLGLMLMMVIRTN